MFSHNCILFNSRTIIDEYYNMHRTSSLTINAIIYILFICCDLNYIFQNDTIFHVISIHSNGDFEQSKCWGSGPKCTYQ